MAITKSLLRFLLTQRSDYGIGNRDGRILTLGVQDIHATHDEISTILRSRGIEPIAIEPSNRKYTKSQVVSSESSYAYVKDLFRMLGFNGVETLDFSAAEQPDHVHDLNYPVNQALCGNGGSGGYDVVLDVGVLEHIYNVRQSVENVMRMTKLGGSVVLVLPLFGWHNMVYFNFQPPFFPEVFLANGFGDVRTFVNYYPIWREWDDRKLIYQEFRYGDEIAFTKPFYRTNLIFLARKKTELKSFVMPNQGWYVEYHEQCEGNAQPQPDPPESHAPMRILKSFVRHAMPYWFNARIWNLLDARARARTIKSGNRARFYL